MVGRAEAAPYVDYPPTPWWYFPSVGLWVAALIGAFAWWRENTVLFIGTIVVPYERRYAVAAAKVRERLA